jgi:hypothetical protein
MKSIRIFLVSKNSKIFPVSKIIHEEVDIKINIRNMNGCNEKKMCARDGTALILVQTLF